jgi:hypothetical protein
MIMQGFAWAPRLEIWIVMHGRALSWDNVAIMLRHGKSLDIGAKVCLTIPVPESPGRDGRHDAYMRREE